MIEGTYIQTNDQYSQGVVLDDYSGKISICSANEGKDGTVYMQWCYPQKDKKPIAKSLPWKIELGDIQQAIGTLKTLTTVLEKMGSGGQEQKTPDDVPPMENSDIPF